MKTTIIKHTAEMLYNNGYLYTYHWLRYDMRHPRYESLRTLWAARCWLPHWVVA